MSSFSPPRLHLPLDVPSPMMSSTQSQSGTGLATHSDTTAIPTTTLVDARASLADANGGQTSNPSTTTNTAVVSPARHDQRLERYDHQPDITTAPIFNEPLRPPGLIGGSSPPPSGMQTTTRVFSPNPVPSMSKSPSTAGENGNGRSVSPSQRFLLSSSNGSARARERSTSSAEFGGILGGSVTSPSSSPARPPRGTNAATPGTSIKSNVAPPVRVNQFDQDVGMHDSAVPTSILVSPRHSSIGAAAGHLRHNPDGLRIISTATQISIDSEDEVNGDLRTSTSLSPRGGRSRLPSHEKVMTSERDERGSNLPVLAKSNQVGAMKVDGVSGGVTGIEEEGDVAQIGGGEREGDDPDDEEEEEEEEEDEEEEEEEEDEEDSSDDDEEDDDDRSIAVESDDEPVFVSVRGPSGKMDLNDLLIHPSPSSDADPNAIGFGGVKVKLEPGEHSRVDALEDEDAVVVDGVIRNGNERDSGSGEESRAGSTMGSRGLKRDADERIAGENALGMAVKDGRQAGSNVKRARLATVESAGDDSGLSTSGRTAETSATLPGQAEALPGNTAIPAPDGTLASPTIQPLAVDANGQPINVLVAKPKQKRKRAASVEVAPPPPPMPRQTIRIEISFRPPGAQDEVPLGTTFHAIGTESFYKIISFKEESVRAGVVEEAYWNPPTVAADADVDGASDKESGDDDQMDGFAKDKMGKAKGGGAPPLRNLADLILATDDADEAEMLQLAAELEAKYETKPTRRRRRVKADLYDDSDPFIDDSELRIDEPEFYQQPKKPGFFVQKGPIELMQEPPAKPAKAKINGTAPIKNKHLIVTAVGGDVKQAIKKRKTFSMTGMGRRPTANVAKARDLGSIAGPSNSGSSGAWAAVGDSQVPNGHIQEGDAQTRSESPEIQVISETSQSPVQQPAKSLAEALARLPDSVAARLRDLRARADEEDWTQKRTFPEALVEPCLRAGRAAIRAGVFDEVYFEALPFCINYNKFTMKKWSLGKLEPFSQQWAMERDQDLLRSLKIEVDAVMPLMIEDYLTAQSVWEQLMEEHNAAMDSHRDPLTGNISIEAMASLPPPKEPPKRFKWNPEIRQLFWELVKIRDEATEYARMLAEVRKETKSAAGQALRGKLYTQLVATIWPAGWMTTAILSREMSQIKKKV